LPFERSTAYIGGKQRRAAAYSPTPQATASQKRTVSMSTHTHIVNARRAALSLASVLFLTLGCATQKTVRPERTGPPAESYEYCMEQAKTYLASSAYDKAIEQLVKATELQPESAKAHNLLGLAYFQHKQRAQAEESFTKALALEPSNASAHANLGALCYLRQDYGRAKELFAKALALSPNLVAANYSMGNTMIALGQTDEGMAYLAKGIALNPNYLDSRASVVASASNPTMRSATIHFLYAKLFAATGNLEKTVEYLAKAKSEGFRDWSRITQEQEFERLRGDARIKEFLP
jgi:tetratricopeptide (TPR) repeat protein